jgi:4-nitrophenol 2-monooxygenase / 4-nitrocatechol 4-monooxygenase, reductase component
MGPDSTIWRHRGLAADQFRDVIGRFASGVTIITTVQDGQPYGTTASAVTSLSLEPPMIVVCMNRSSATGQAMARAGRFAVSILSEDQADLAARFATKEPDKFRGLLEGTTGLPSEPLIPDSLATLECRTVNQVEGGTHIVFLADVERATARDGAPLAYFRGKFGRLEMKLDDALGNFIARPVTPELVADTLRGRCAIEVGVAMSTVTRLSSIQLVECRRLVDALRSQEPNGRPVTRAVWVARLTAFQDYMVGLGASEGLLNAYRRLNVSAMITSLAGGDDVRMPLPGDVQREHVELVEAYERSDRDSAVSAIRRRIQRSIEIVATYMREHGSL